MRFWRTVTLVLVSSVTSACSLIFSLPQYIERKIEESYTPRPNYLYLKVRFRNPTGARLSLNGHFLGPGPRRYKRGEQMFMGTEHHCELGFDVSKLSAEWAPLETDSNLSAKFRGCNITRIEARALPQGGIEILLPRIEFTWDAQVPKSILVREPYVVLNESISSLQNIKEVRTLECVLPKPTVFYLTKMFEKITQENLQFVCTECSE